MSQIYKLKLINRTELMLEKIKNKQCNCKYIEGFGLNWGSHKVIIDLCPHLRKELYDIGDKNFLLSVVYDKCNFLYKGNKNYTEVFSFLFELKRRYPSDF